MILNMSYSSLNKIILADYFYNTILLNLCAIFLLLLCTSCSNNFNSVTNNKDSIQSKNTTSDYIRMLQSKANEAYQNKEYEKALKYYNLLLEQDSSNGAYYFRKAFCLDYLKQTDRAIIFYNKALVFDSTRSLSHFNLSLIYTSKLQDSLALFHVNEYLKLKPLDSEAIHLKKLILLMSQNNENNSKN